ncbi:DUF4360 domain-containing protein [Actinomadura spongiicola]|uniref:DUF4360 domain-containing protein n=1 Tax=Actinomadura spongiicola TaxID=2303421 RepID=A0A372GGP0_9ACTN|nr:DUF4360 domain-containing protein [Actinomadura spongiicola]RFS84554.1 DUF4360 domain-containing protein [Actinomadura spongiicola]
MRKGIAISAAAAAAMALTAASVSPAAASGGRLLERGPSGVTIEIATVNGSGCPIGTAAVALSPDKEAFTVTYSDYMAQAGAQSNPRDMRKNCQINMKVHVPQGFTYAIAKVDYRGYAFLEKGSNATMKASYYFQGMTKGGSVESGLKGPKDDNWQETDLVPIEELIWKPCGELRNFNINTELRVTAPTDKTQTSFITMDSTDGSIKTVYHFKWRTCP